MFNLNSFLAEMSSPKRILLFALVTILLVFPAITTDYYVLTIFIYANVYAVFAASWDMLAGVTGQFSFGQALFFGVAAYVSGNLNLYQGLEPWMAIPLGGAFGVIVGFVVALPSLRLKGPYFAITSLIFPSILSGIIFMYPELTGGEEGLYGLTQLSNNITVTYYLSLFLMLISILVLFKIASSRIGMIFRSIRDDEEVAEASGINTVKYKFLSFGLSGLFAGIAGAFQAHLLMFVGPFIFNPFYSFQAMLYAGLGGMGTIVGSVVGAYMMSTLNEMLRDLVEFRVLMTAIVMLLVFRYLPGGLFRWISNRFKIHIGIWSGIKKFKRRK
jgi:branched-chain amino acid transport system permease protein